MRNPPTTHAGPPYTGNVLGTNCECSESNNFGCGFADTRETSFGHGFNMNGGGVFAHLLDKKGLRIWFFERNSIPQDIHEGRPNPASWPSPVAFWSSTGCDFPAHVYNQHLVLNIALCGNWDSSDYSSSGCPGTCAGHIMKGRNFRCVFPSPCVFCVSYGADRETRCQMGYQLHRCL